MCALLLLSQEDFTSPCPIINGLRLRNSQAINYLMTTWSAVNIT